MNALETSVLAETDPLQPAAPGQRVIKKYPNRRLYDTVQSRYITLADVRELVLNGVDFAVIDKKTQHDITGCILLQVICEQEQVSPVLSNAFLTQVIRSHGEGRRGMFGKCIEHSLSLLTLQHADARQYAHQT